MSGAVILNWVLGAIIVVVIIGGGFYAVFRHGQAGPNYREARTHYQAKEDPSVTPLSDYVPTDQAVTHDGLAEPQIPLEDPGESGRDAGQPSGGATAGPARDQD
jgi:hypothetical protein